LFALDQLDISEIGRLKDYHVFPIPHSLPICVGAVQHRGKVIPVLSGAQLFQPSQVASSTISQTEQLIFFNTAVGPMAFTVDSISQDPLVLSEFGEWTFIQLSDYF